MSLESDPIRHRGRMLRRFFAAKALEEAALAVHRRPSPAWAREMASGVLVAVHRSVLRWIAALPPAPARAPVGLGLADGRTLVAPSDPSWALRYSEEAELVRTALGGLAAELHHIGSTAVPGLPAKPIIDLAVALPADGSERARAEALRRLAGVGYRYRGNRQRRGGHYLAKFRDGRRTHAVQVHAQASPELAELLRFRELLRRDRPLAEEYGRIKGSLAAAVGDDRRIYVWYKSHWINERVADPGRGPWSAYLLRQGFPSLRRLFGAGTPRLRA
ncbi:MAG TPA: GrpB family protein [Opitutaceae bacterium]|nr:GrpB family protein [Opitutaceae bacterium]